MQFQCKTVKRQYSTNNPLTLLLPLCALRFLIDRMSGLPCGQILFYLWVKFRACPAEAHSGGCGLIIPHLSDILFKVRILVIYQCLFQNQPYEQAQGSEPSADAG
jgi:hypothetical protein